MKLSALILLAVAAALFASLRALGTAQADSGGGSHTTYYASGRIESECAVRDGRRDGACRRFYPDGSRMAEGRYAGGKMQGAWTFWREDGTVDLDRSGLYEAGTRIGSDSTPGAAYASAR